MSRTVPSTSAGDSFPFWRREENVAVRRSEREPKTAMVPKISRENCVASYPGGMLLVPFEAHEPVISPDAFVAPTATLVGQVTVGANTVVMFGAVLRADRDRIVLGQGSNLQDNVVVHGDPGSPALIGEGVSVGHGAIVHGATIENDCLIGMGATLLNGSVIGAGSLVAAGSVVLEGTVIPPGSLVAGVPAKVRRELTESEHEAIRKNALTYQELGRSYRGI